MEFKISKFRHPKEKFYGSLMLLFGGAVWGLLALAIATALYFQPLSAVVLVLYVAIVWFVSYVARALMRAYMIGHYVMVSEKQFPHLNQMVEEAARKVGLKKAPHAFVYNSSGVMNAMALTLVGRARYIWLTSALIDADNDEQVRFVIGHEIGHHVSGHLDEPGTFIKLPAYIIPFLGSAYSRARELTCDRIGTFVCGNLGTAQSALQMLASGSAKLNAEMNVEAFREQERMVPGIAGWFLNIVSFYPRLTKRVDALGTWMESLRANPNTAQAQRARVGEPLLQN